MHPPRVSEALVTFGEVRRLRREINVELGAERRELPTVVRGADDDGAAGGAVARRAAGEVEERVGRRRDADDPESERWQSGACARLPCATDLSSVR